MRIYQLSCRILPLATRCRCWLLGGEQSGAPSVNPKPELRKKIAKGGLYFYQRFIRFTAMLLGHAVVVGAAVAGSLGPHMNNERPYAIANPPQPADTDRTFRGEYFEVLNSIELIHPSSISIQRPLFSGCEHVAGRRAYVRVFSESPCLRPPFPCS